MSQNNGMVCNFRNLQKQVTGKENKMPVVVFNPLSIDGEKFMEAMSTQNQKLLFEAISVNNTLRCEDGKYYLIPFPTENLLADMLGDKDKDFHIVLPTIKDTDQVHQVTIFLLKGFNGEEVGSVQIHTSDSDIVDESKPIIPGRDDDSGNIRIDPRDPVKPEPNPKPGDSLDEVPDFKEEIPLVCQDGFVIEPDCAYEINALYNGDFWTIAAIKISDENYYRGLFEYLLIKYNPEFAQIFGR